MMIPNGQTITQVWNAIVNSSGLTVTARNVAYNGSIPDQRQRHRADLDRLHQPVTRRGGVRPSWPDTPTPEISADQTGTR